jgi:uncharacterized protein (TIGR02996 family)
MSMLDHGPFLQTILARPNDSGPRLVYADWLEEQGDCHRAEFLRLDTEWLELPKTDPRRIEIARRLVNLFYRHGDKWERPLSELPGQTIIDFVPAAFRVAPICELRVDLAGLQVENAVLQMVPESVVRENRVFPLTKYSVTPLLVYPFPLRFRCIRRQYHCPPAHRELFVFASGTQMSSEIVQKLEFILNCNVLCLLADYNAIVEAIERHYGAIETECVDCILAEFP